MNVHWWATRPWGDWGTWAGAIGTIAAFLAVVFQLRRESRIRREGDADRRRREERAQAEMITAWMSKVHFDGEKLKQNDGSKQGVVVQNSSGQAIFNVTVTRLRRISKDQGLDEAEKSPVFIRSVPPGMWYTEAVQGFSSGDRNVVLPISFMDGRGKAWARDREGMLKELPVDDLPREGQQIPVVGIRGVSSRDSIA